MELKEFRNNAEKIIDVIDSIFVGDRSALIKILCAVLANGHVLFEDYPGLGKTLLAKMIAKVMGCSWGRIQFTSDLMPADILGTRVWRGSSSEFVLEKGPIFTNILLADEINRSPPKIQSALLEAMEERQATIEGTTYKLDRPFFVIATQNPIELEGTFPLPEAQLDRFMLKMSTGYVRTLEMESEILRRRIQWRSDHPLDGIPTVIEKDILLEMQDLVETGVYVDGQILDYISGIVRATRQHPAVEVGSSPRGGLALLKTSKAYAALSGRDFVTPDDVKTLAEEALGHRLILKIEYEIDGNLTTSSIVEEVLSKITPPRGPARLRGTI